MEEDFQLILTHELLGNYQTTVFHQIQSN